MRLSRVFTIARKELSETVRDRRTLLLMIGLPLLLYPLMIIGISRLQEAGREATETRISTVGVWGIAPADFIDHLSRALRLRASAWHGAPLDVRATIESGTVTVPPQALPAASGDSTRERQAAERRAELTEQPNPVLDAARHAIASGTVDAVVVIWPGSAQAIGGGAEGTISVYFDSVDDDSATAARRLDDALDEYRRELVDARRRARGLPEGFVTGVELRRRDVSPPERRAGRLLGAFLPFVLLSLSLVGGFYSAVDLTAGEKERGTMQTLLCAPVSALEIVVGKFLAVWGIGILSSATNILSLGLTTARVLPGESFHLPVSSFALAGLLILPVSMTTTALFLAVAAFARDFKDGQNLLTPVYMVLIMPAAGSMVPSVQLDPWTAFVPLVNIALLIKALFAGSARGELVFLAVVSSASYALLALLFAVRVFDREQILLGGRESWRTLLGLERRNGGRPTAGIAAVTFAVALVAAFYGSLLLESRGVATTLLATQLGFFLLPALAVVVGLGFDVKDTFALRRPPAMALLAAVLLGSSAWAGVLGVVMRIAPPPDSLVRALERLLQLGDVAQPLWVILLAVALLPAVCEELFFRGLVMSGLRRLGRWPAMICTALLFSVAHASIYRLLPTLALGLVLCYAVWKSGSILTSMIVHCLNNGLAVLMAERREWFSWAVDTSQPLLPWRVTLAGLAVTAVGLWLLSRLPDDAAAVRAG